MRRLIFTETKRQTPHGGSNQQRTTDCIATYRINGISINILQRWHRSVARTVLNDALCVFRNSLTGGQHTISTGRIGRIAYCILHMLAFNFTERKYEIFNNKIIHTTCGERYRTRVSQRTKRKRVAILMKSASHWDFARQMCTHSYLIVSLNKCLSLKCCRNYTHRATNQNRTEAELKPPNESPCSAVQSEKTTCYGLCYLLKRCAHAYSFF